MPQASSGGSLSGGVGLGTRWEITSAASYISTQRAEAAGARFAFSSTDAFLGVGYLIHAAPSWKLGLYGGPLIGWMHAVPESPLPFDPGDSFYGGLRISASAALRVYERLGVALGIGGQALMSGWKFRIRGRSEPVWSQPPFGADADLSIIWGMQ